jgi:hypothetical protein
MAVGLLLPFAAKLLNPPVVAVITKTVPFLLGAVFVGKLEAVRDQLCRMASRWWIGLIAVAVDIPLLILHGLGAITVDLPVRLAPSADVVLNRTQQFHTFRGAEIRMPVSGIDIDTLVVMERLANQTVEDTFTLGLKEKWRLARHLRTREKPLMLGASHVVVVLLPPAGDNASHSKPADLIVEGEFPELFVWTLQRRKTTLVENLGRGRARVTYRIADGMLQRDLRLPTGSYDFTLRDYDGCRRRLAEKEVVAFSATYNTLDFQNEPCTA